MVARRTVLFSSFLMVALAAPALPGPIPIRVTPADAPTIKQAIAAKRGQVVVVNFWATWCGPCVAEFPALVKLQKEYKRQGLVVVTVSADSARDIRSKVVPFLEKQGAQFPQFLEKADDPQDFINAFDPNWQGDLPRTFVYDRQGRLVKELSGEHTEKEFAAAVKPLLTEK